MMVQKLQVLTTRHISSFLRDRQEGQTLVIFSLALVLFIGMLGIVLDMGHSTVKQRQMQFAADAAALAGAMDLASGRTATVATTRMQGVLTANGANAQLSTFVVVNGSRTNVSAKTTVPALFTGLFGIDQISVEAHATAAAGQLRQTANLMPFVVEENLWALGQTVVLWGEKNGPGNFGWVRWWGENPSTPNLRYNIDNPSKSDVVSIGSRVSGSTGVSFGAVQGNLNAWIGKRVTVILYDPAEIQGTGAGMTYKVRGFAHFIVNGTYSNGSHSEIYGSFVSYVTLGADINAGVLVGAQGIGLLQ